MDITDLINSIVNENQRKKEQLLRTLVNCDNLDEIPIRGRREIHPDKEIYFWDNAPVVEFYTPKYTYSGDGDNIRASYELNYKIL
jgi:hypothetical protein